MEFSPEFWILSTEHNDYIKKFIWHSLPFVVLFKMHFFLENEQSDPLILLHFWNQHVCKILHEFFENFLTSETTYTQYPHTPLKITQSEQIYLVYFYCQMGWKWRHIRLSATNFCGLVAKQPSGPTHFSFVCDNVLLAWFFDCQFKVTIVIS